MILTITLNPSIDITYLFEYLTIDSTNRGKNVHKTAGGKGLNVARILKQLDTEVLASGLLGGNLGAEVKEKLAESRIAQDFLSIKEETRNCIAILHEGKQTEILETGPKINEKDAKSFLAHLKKLVQKASVVVFSGSLPEGLSIDFYSRMIARCGKKPVILDCSGQSLLYTLKSQNRPKMIKPNLFELEELLDRPISSDYYSLEKALSNAMFSQVEWVVVSLGDKGLFAKHRNQFYRVEIPKIKTVNPVGSGDAMIAGFAYALEKNETDEELLKRGTVLGMLNAQEERPGCVNLASYHHFYEQIKVIKD